GVLVALRPVWWVLRGWVWFVATAGLFRPVVAVTQHQVYLPETFLGWVWFGAAVLLSVQYGRGLLRGARWGRRVLRVASVVTAIVVVPLMAAFLGYLQNQLAVGRSYVEVPVYLDHPAAVVENGVFVDGMQVSNLFV